MINGTAFGVEPQQILKLADAEVVNSVNFESIDDITSEIGKGIEVTGDYVSVNDLLIPKVVVDITNSHILKVTNEVAESDGVSSGIYIPGTDKLTEFVQDEDNSSFTVTNDGEIDVEGTSAYGIHVELLNPEVPEAVSSTTVEDPLYAYPDIDINNSGLEYADGIYVVGDVEAEGIKINTPFSKVNIDNAGTIDAKVSGTDDSNDLEKITFGGAAGINLFIPAEVEELENPDPKWGIISTKEEEEISPIPMKVAINNIGEINVSAIDKDVARIMGINVGEYDDHTLTVDTEFIEPVAEDIIIPESVFLKTISAQVFVASESKEVVADPKGETASTPESTQSSEAVTLSSSKKGKHSGSDGSGGCGSKPLDALVFNNITNEGNINIDGKNLSAVQAVGINSRMSEGTQSTITNAEKGNIKVEVTMTNARQTKMAEDPTSGNLYGINVFNSGRPSRVNANNEGDITVTGTIVEQAKDKTAAENPVGIQSFGMKVKARGRDSVSDINNTGNITVTSIEQQNINGLDYIYHDDTEGKEIFGARAVGIYGTSAGRGAYTEITNGDYDITVDQDAMDKKRSGEEVNIYEEVKAELKNQYYNLMNDFNTFTDEINANINATASSDYGYAEAKGIWSTSEAIENSQFVYNSEDSSIKAEATATNRGAEALGIESVSFQNTVINQGLINVVSDGKTATGIGILAEVSELEEEEMNEHARKPESIGADIGMPYDLPGKRDEHQGGEDEKTDSVDEINNESILKFVADTSAAPVTEISSTLLSRSAVIDTVAAAESKGKDESASDTKKPEIGIKNKYILNTGTIIVDVNKDTDVQGDFAFGAGIASSRVVAEMITGDRVNDFIEPIETFAVRSMALDTPETDSGEVDGVGGATNITSGEAPEESLNQNITNNGLIDLFVRGKTALASGISSLTKVDVLFDTDGDGVSDGVDEKPLDPSFAHDLDKDGTDDRLDEDADGDGFKSIAFGGLDYFDNDSDNDGISNRMDNDDDGDGILDADEIFIEGKSNITAIAIDGKLIDETIGFVPITAEQYAVLTNTPGGMPENLIETSGILEPEEAIINNSFTNNGRLNVNAVSDSIGGEAIANGIGTDVVWNGLQKPIYVTPDGEATSDVAPEGVVVDIIEKNYDRFVNSEEAVITATAIATEGTALAFGMRDGNYYTIDKAADERTPITKRYAGTMSEDGSTLEDYGMVNEGNINVTASGLETKAFGIMSGYYDEEGDTQEQFVISTVKNTGDINVNSDGSSVDSIGAGIVAFADQQIEFLPKVLEGGVLLAAAEEETTEIIAAEDEKLVFEDYVVKDPEKAVVVVENSGNIRVTGNNEGQNYGVYAGINLVDKDSIEEQEIISVKEIILSDATVTSEEIKVETQNGNDGESVEKVIGTTYTVTTADDEVYQFVMHATEDKGEDIPDKIYVVVDGTPNEENGFLKPDVDETYKIGKTDLMVSNSGNITVAGKDGVGIYLASRGTIENSGTIRATKAIVTSDEDDIIDLKSGSEIYGDIETGGGNDTLNIFNETITRGNIILGDGTLNIKGNGTLVIDMKGTSKAIERGTITASKMVIDGKLIYDIGKVNKLGTSSFDYTLKDGMIMTSTDGKANPKTSTYAWDASFVEEIPVPEVSRVVSLLAAEAPTLLAAEPTILDTTSITFARVGFQELADKENDELASILDTDYETNSSTELADVYSTLENEVLSTNISTTLAADALNTALKDIRGTEYAAYPFINLSISKAFGENTKSFMDSTDTNIFSDENASMVDMNSDTGVHQYINVLGNYGEYDNSDTENFDFDTYGVILGNDKKLESGDRVGITYGYADTNVDYDDGGSGETSTFHVGGFHKKEEGRWLLKSTLAFDYNKNDVDRVVWVGAEKYEPNTDFNSYVISAGSEVSYDYNIENWIVRPLAGLNYSRIEQDSFKEDTVIGLERDSEGFNSLASEVGVKAIKEFYTPNSQLKLYFDISWLHEYGDVYDDQDLKLAGDNYKISGLGMNDDAYRIGMGVDIDTNSNWSFNVKYSYENGSSYDGNRISTGIRYKF